MNNFLKSLWDFILNNKLKKEERKMETVETKAETKKEKTVFGFKIDRVKWKNDVDAILLEREEKRANTEKKNWAALDYHFDDRLTKLYSIRAHARGRVHRKFAILNEYDWRKLGHKEPNWKEFIANNGMIKFPLTIVDQAVYIGDGWKEYEKII
jgi:hypothetical protein